MDKNLEIIFNELGNAIERLGEALEFNPSENSLAIDASIQRFEFVIELYWKTFKKCLAENGIEANLPKEALRGAYVAKWIKDDKLWIDMMLDRNLTSHTYREKTAHEIYERIKVYYPELKHTFSGLLKHFQK